MQKNKSRTFPLFGSDFLFCFVLLLVYYFFSLLFELFSEIVKASIQVMEKDLAENVYLDYQRRDSHFECIPNDKIKEICKKVRPQTLLSFDLYVFNSKNNMVCVILCEKELENFQRVKLVWSTGLHTKDVNSRSLVEYYKQVFSDGSD